MTPKRFDEIETNEDHQLLSKQLESMTRQEHKDYMESQGLFPCGHSKATDLDTVCWSVGKTHREIYFPPRGPQYPELG